MHLERLGRAKSPIEKYDALNDKFASFYFSGYGVKKHLKKLRKVHIESAQVIELEPHRKEYREYSQMLSQKLTQLELEEQQNNRVKPYEQSLKPASLHKLRKMQNFFEDKPNHTPANQPQPQQHPHKPLLSLPKPALNNLPTITKSSQHLRAIPMSPHKEKEEKSISVAEHLGKSLSKGKRLSCKRDKSEKLFQGNKGALKRQQQVGTIQEVLKEVRHDEFLTFLRQRQQELMTADKSIKNRLNTQHVEHPIEEAIE